MKKQIISLLISCFLLSCADESTQSPPEEIIATTTQACYSYMTNRDTVLLDMVVSGTLVRGNLIYRLFEKDGNKGPIRGTMHGDTLYADYRFSSEGIETIREVAFLKKDNMLAEGYGAVEEKDGKMIFKNRQEINFGKGVVLQKIDCTK